MSTEKEIINVFIASPGDVELERKIFREIIESINSEIGSSKNLLFKAQGWEDVHASTGPRAQSVINEMVDKCHIFILVMHCRWGKPVTDSFVYSSYTEEEYHKAFQRYKLTNSPRIITLFKSIGPEPKIEGNEQISNVLAFKKQLEDSRCVIHKTFDTPQSFERLIREYLNAFINNSLSNVNPNEHEEILPVEWFQKMEEIAKTAQNESKQRILYQLEIARDAAKFALKGEIEFAKEKFNKLCAESSNLQVLYLGYEFFYRIGDLTSATNAINKWIEISGPNAETRDTAAALCNLGNLHFRRNELEQSNAVYLNALSVYKKLGITTGSAIIYGNMANIYHKLNARPEKTIYLYNKAIELSKQDKDFPLLAHSYLHFGKYLSRFAGNLIPVLALHDEALKIYMHLNDTEGIERTKNSFGSTHLQYGNLDLAEEFLTNSLAFYDKIGSKEEYAMTTCSLAVLHKKKNDFSLSKSMYVKAQNIFSELNRPDKVELIRQSLKKLP